MRKKREGLTLGRVVVRQGHIAIEGDANLAALSSLELLAVELACVRVREDQVVADTRSRGGSQSRSQSGRKMARRGGQAGDANRKRAQRQLAVTTSEE